jgi:hypothetical protein
MLGFIVHTLGLSHGSSISELGIFRLVGILHGDGFRQFGEHLSFGGLLLVFEEELIFGLNIIIRVVFKY